MTKIFISFVTLLFCSNQAFASMATLKVVYDDGETKDFTFAEGKENPFDVRIKNVLCKVAFVKETGKTTTSYITCNHLATTPKKFQDAVITMMNTAASCDGAFSTLKIGTKGKGSKDYKYATMVLSCS